MAPGRGERCSTGAGRPTRGRGAGPSGGCPDRRGCASGGGAGGSGRPDPRRLGRGCRPRALGSHSLTGSSRRRARPRRGGGARRGLPVGGRFALWYLLGGKRGVRRRRRVLLAPGARAEGSSRPAAQSAWNRSPKARLRRPARSWPGPRAGACRRRPGARLVAFLRGWLGGGDIRGAGSGGLKVLGSLRDLLWRLAGGHLQLRCANAGLLGNLQRSRRSDRGADPLPEGAPCISQELARRGVPVAWLLGHRLLQHVVQRGR